MQKREVEMYFNGLIDTFEKLMDEISYDWPGSDWPKEVPKITKYCRRTDGITGYGMHKTSVYFKDEKYWVDYKEEQYELTKEVFDKFEKFYELLYGDLT